MKFYIAYGSNLNKRQMEKRCPGAKVVGTAIIEGWELLFRGSKTGSYLTIEKKDGCRIPVAVWGITEAHERALDIYEGYPSFYYKRDFTLDVTSEDGSVVTLDTFAYIMHEDRPIGIPSDYYVRVCEAGYYDFGFDNKYLYDALEKSVEKVG